MASDGHDIKSDESLLMCSNCVKVKRNREAVKYCVECQAYCCQTCVDSHETIPALSTHQLLDKTSFKSSGVTSDIPVVPTEKCYLHEAKIVDFFCKSHDVVGCSTCMVLEHRSCLDVHSIPKEIDDLFDHSDIDKTVQHLQEMTKTSEKVLKLKQTQIQHLHRSKEEAVLAAKEFRKDMESVLNRLERETLKEVEVQFEKLEAILKQEMKRADEENESLKQAALNLQKSETNKAQTFVSLKNAQKKIKDAGKKSFSKDPPVNDKIVFVPDSDFQNFLKDLESFGRLESTSYEQRTTSYTVKAKTTINIQIPSDSKTSNVIGSCTTEDCLLLLADSYNKKLKRVVPGTSSIVDYCDLPASPYDVCCIGKHAAAVTLSNKTVDFVVLEKTMKLSGQLKLNHNCYGIAYKEQKLYISDNGMKVYIHDMTGNQIDTISTDESGNSLFGINRLLSVNDSGDKIFVADWNLGLVTLEAKGRRINTFSDPELTAATGICTDGGGNIFVCGWNSHNVMLITQNGKKVGVVLGQRDGLRAPLSVSFDSQHLRLFVTQESSSIVKVFELK